ncbi:MAG TPA: ABC transporter permease [Acidimicrobiales bacterium]|nr:ABC transporter permease [Acidimicrobiales bacterium]
MTTTATLTPTTPATAPHKSSLRWAASDVFVIARRDLLAMIRIPTAVVFMFVQPIMFVLLFRYVFGGAIHTQGITKGQYVNYLIPGILVQTTIFGAINTAIGLAEDLQKGLIERFKALPMARLAVLGGRTVADLARNVLVVLIITGVGFLVGFRPGGGFISYVEASLLMLFFAYCLSWGFAFIGLSAPNSETAQAMAFPLVFPLTFASNVFVPLNDMPSWLQVFARNQPVSQAAEAVRSLMLGGPIGNSVWLTLAWGLGALCVLTPLATRRYSRTD